MRAVVQRVKRAEVRVEQEVVSRIGSGLVVLLGVGKDDTAEAGEALAEKIANLRVFDDGEGRMNRSLLETGGQAFFPRFLQEYPSIFQTIATALRNQYSITYRPSNQAKDGSVRKLKVELVDPQTGEALRITEKGKPVKYTIVTKDSYTAPRPVE